MQHKEQIASIDGTLFPSILVVKWREHSKHVDHLSGAVTSTNYKVIISLPQTQAHQKLSARKASVNKHVGTLFRCSRVKWRKTCV